MIIEFKDCRDCPYKGEVQDMGASWAECSHRKAKGFPYAILWGCQEHFKKIPTWCPIKR